MPKWITVAFALFLSLHVFSTQARTVDEVISNHVKATARMYGHERNQRADGFHGGDASPVKKMPDITNGGAVHTISGAPVESDMPQIALEDVNELVNYAAKGNKAVLAGKEVRRNRECYHIQLTLWRGQKADYYIDAANWRIIETRVNKQ